ncbi:amidohydrolase family protein [Tenacibaculum ovolyticum]|uniref:amidohydrolase family protein n=1 Tax=Tenacibaculum ovolyticum TaxID=104270 RepID=UPI0022F39F09|nr:amidohydrolase family protein [Tenacibaculum ovolyticum]WBX75406.1 amidohydrolase family protein [Tenacibaculum ovolyticum]
MKIKILLIAFIILSLKSFSQEEISKGYTAFHQVLELKNTNYKKVKLSAYVKTKVSSTKSSAILWMKDMDVKEEMLTFVQTDDKTSSNEVWQKYVLEIELKRLSNKLFLGALTVGFGKFYFDNFKAEALNQENKWISIKIENNSFDKKVSNNIIPLWKEGISEKGFRSTYYTLKTAYSNSKGKDSLALLIEGRLPKVDLYPDIKVKSVKLNTKNESILITNISVINVENGSVKKLDVLLSEGKIKRISEGIKQSIEYKVIDGKGKWLSPGLVDSHIHLFQSGGLYTRPDALDLTSFKGYEKERKWLKRYAADILKRYLRCGITTVIDVGGPMYNYNIRDKYSDKTSYPNLYLTGPLISTYQPSAFDIEDAPIIKAKTTQEARVLVNEQLEFKPDFIKIWYINTSVKDEKNNYNIVKATIDEAHKNNLKVAVHATQLKTAKRAIIAGADFLVHSIEDEKLDDEFIKLVKDNNVVYIPTLIVSGNYIKAYGQEITPSVEDFNLSNPIPLGSLYDSKKIEIKPIFKKYIDLAKRRKKSLFEEEKIESENLKKAIESGFVVATGTDAGNIGTLHATSYYEELQAMKEAGLSNYQILKASTINGAKVLGKEKLFGSLKEGKMADAIILKSNPLENLEALKDIEYVIKSGSVFPVNQIINDTPELLVQRQVNGYNARNIDAFLEPYSEDFEIYDYPNSFKRKGKEKSRKTYIQMFDKYPKLHCEIISRMVLGNKVIDHERITGVSELPYEAIAVYEIEKGKIQKVTFLRK